MTQERELERFEVLEELTSSEVEVLLRARDKVLGREVLLKLPGPGLASALRNRSVREQTMREARALASVRHDGVVRLHDAIETRQGPLLVLEPVAGEPLSEALEREGRMPVDEAVELGRALADALQSVHAEGIVHRGISESSILVTPSGPVLTGFEFSKLSSAGATMTATSLWYNPKQPREARKKAPAPTPAHPAPEQLRGERADARSDLFAVAWVLFDAIAGAPPFEGDDSSQWLRPRDLRALVPEVSRDLSRILSKCLAPSPVKRYQSAAQLRDALEGLGARNTAAPGPSASRKPTLMVSGMLAVAALGFFGPSFLREVGGGDGRGIGEKRDGPAVENPEAKYESGYSKKYALLIGIDYAENVAGLPPSKRYQPLPNAKRDVEALAERLESLPGNWDVKTLVTPEATTRTSIGEALEQIAGNASREDCVFIYYAGHGVESAQSGKHGWLVPSDAALDGTNTDEFPFETVNHVFDTEAKHVLLALDCCYSGMATEANRSARSTDFDEMLTTNKAHMIMSSGRGKSEVSDGPKGEHSPFAAAFLEQLESGEVVTARRIALEIRDALLGKYAQSPDLAYHGGNYTPGDFVFHLEK